MPSSTCLLRSSPPTSWLSKKTAPICRCRGAPVTMVMSVGCRMALPTCTVYPGMRKGGQSRPRVNFVAFYSGCTPKVTPHYLLFLYSTLGKKVLLDAHRTVSPMRVGTLHLGPQ